MKANDISQAIRNALDGLTGVSVYSGKPAEWIRNPVYPVVCIEPRTERIEAINPPKVKFSRTWSVEILVDQDDPEPALTLLLREIFEALGLTQLQPQLAGARLSAGDVGFQVFIEHHTQSSAVFQLTATYVE